MSNMELAVNVTVTGIVLVFAMLVLLVFILILFGKISVMVKNSADKKAAKQRAEVLAAMADDSVEEKTVAAVVSDSDGISEEVIAVISAAVSSMYSGTTKKPVVKAIKKSGASRRSPWANAGIIDNTRVF